MLQAWNRTIPIFDSTPLLHDCLYHWWLLPAIWLEPTNFCRIAAMIDAQIPPFWKHSLVIVAANECSTKQQEVPHRRSAQARGWSVCWKCILHQLWSYPLQASRSLWPVLHRIVVTIKSPPASCWTPFKLQIQAQRGAHCIALGPNSMPCNSGWLCNSHCFVYHKQMKNSTALLGTMELGGLLVGSVKIVAVIPGCCQKPLLNHSSPPALLIPGAQPCPSLGGSSVQGPNSWHQRQDKKLY